MSEIKIPISVELGNSLQKLKGLSGELNKVEGDVNDINKESKGTADAIGKIGDAGKKISAEGPATFKAQLRAANEELNRTIVQFGAASPAAQAAAKRVAELKDAIGDAKLLTDAFNPDAKFLAFGNALKGVAGAFSAVQGAQALFGSESKAVQETLLKVQGALALSQGINSVLEAKDAFIALGVQLGIVRTAKIANQSADLAAAGAQVINATAAEGLAVAETEVAVATTAAAGATNLFKTALIATGIGAAVVAIGLLVANWEKVSVAIGLVNREQERYKQTRQDIADVQKEGLKNSADEVTQLQLLYSATQDVSLGIDKRKQAVDLLQSQYPDYFKNLKDEAILAGDAKTQYDNLTQSIIKKGIAAAGEKKIAEINEGILASVLEVQKAEKEINNVRTQGVAIQEKAKAVTIGGRQTIVAPIVGRSLDPKVIEEVVDKIKLKYKDAFAAVEQGQNRINEIVKAVGIGNVVDAIAGKEDPKKATKKIETVAEILKKLDDQIKGLSRLEFVDGIDRTTEKIKLAQEAFDLLVKEKKLTLDDSRLRGVKTLIDSFNVQNLSNQVADVFNNLNKSFKTLEGKRIALGIDVTEDKIKAVQEALNALSGLSIKTDVDITAINNLKATLQGLNIDKLQNQLETGLSDILTREYTLGANLDPEKLKLVQDALKTAFTLGIPSDSPIYAQLNELANRFGKPQEVPLVISIDTKNGNKSLNELERENLERVKKNAEDLAAQISSTIV